MPESLVLKDASQSEREKQIIITSNLQMMAKDMVDLLFRETLASNARTCEIEGETFSCGSANGYFNRRTGQIIAFGNTQETVIRDIKEKDTNHDLCPFFFRIAIDKHHKPGIKKIVDAVYGNPHRMGKEAPFIIEQTAKIIMDETVEKYNTRLKDEHRTQK